MDMCNEKFDEKRRINRFRPNIVISDCPPFADDAWSCVMIGDLRFRNVKPCARCPIPRVCQETGERDKKDVIYATLKNFRLKKHLMLGEPFKASDYFFGSNMVVDQMSGTVSVGDHLRILTLKPTGSIVRSSHLGGK